MRIMTLCKGAAARAVVAILLLVAGAGIFRPAPANAIVGGKPASTKTYPWAVALTTPLISFTFCGGALITPTKVLTAAHCASLFQKVPGLLHVVAGRDKISGSGGTDVTVKSIWIDPAYATFTFKGETGYRNDVAVLTLSKSLHYATIPFAKPDNGVLYRPGNKARILGWGTSSEKGLTGGILRTAIVLVVADSACASRASYGSAYSATQYTCAGYYAHGGVDTCTYDSGTPLVINGIVAGITSWGVGCARPHYPGLYTKVMTFAKEIAAHL
jgi:secreted trypsin-like serine protease